MKEKYHQVKKGWKSSTKLWGQKLAKKNLFNYCWWVRNPKKPPWDVFQNPKSNANKPTNLNWLGLADFSSPSTVVPPKSQGKFLRLSTYPLLSKLVAGDETKALIFIHRPARFTGGTEPFKGLDGWIRKKLMWINTDIYVYIWVFPKIMVPPNHPFTWGKNPKKSSFGWVPVWKLQAAENFEYNWIL